MSELSAADFLRVHGNAIMAEGYYALGERLLAIADRLETLERENARLKDLVQKWRDTCTGRHGSQMPCVGRILP